MYSTGYSGGLTGARRHRRAGGRGERQPFAAGGEVPSSSMRAESSMSSGSPAGACAVDGRGHCGAPMDVTWVTARHRQTGRGDGDSLQSSGGASGLEMHTGIFPVRRHV